MDKPIVAGLAGCRRRLLNAIGLAGLLAVVTALRLKPDLFDHAAARAMNRLAAQSGEAGQLANAITFPAVQGVAVVSLACGCWFARASPAARERLLRGCVAAVLAAAAAHFLQEALPPVRKPLFDPALQLDPLDAWGSLDELRASSNPYSQSFPSERTTLFAGIAIAVRASCRTVGLVALAATAAVELCRVYLGLHYPTDIVGSFVLAALVYVLVDTTPRFGLDHLTTNWERASPTTFYLVAFAGCYGLATAFEDVRTILPLLRHYAYINGR